MSALWTLIQGGKVYITTVTDLVADGPVASTPCPGRCGRAITQVTVVDDADPAVLAPRYWVATCPCGARAEILNDWETHEEDR